MNRQKWIVVSTILLVTGVVFSACGAVATPTDTAVPEKATLTIRPTETETPTTPPTVIPTQAGIDMEKFYNFPASYEYLLAHLNEFVKCPYLPETEHDEYVNWVNTVLAPALVKTNSINAREVNYDAGGVGFQKDRLQVVSHSGGDPVNGRVGFYYIVGQGGEIQPVPLLNVYQDGFFSYTVGLILIKDWAGYDETANIQLITEGVKFRTITVSTAPSSFNSDSVNKDITADFVQNDGQHLIIGLGAMNKQ